MTSPSTNENWSPDALGNFSSITTNGGTQTRTHNQQNEITSISGLTSPTYDINGNLTTDELGHTYQYDAWNRLISVKNGATTLASYAYDGLDRRIKETHGSTVNDLYYSAAWQVLEERTGGVSTATIQYVWSPVYIDALVLRDRSTLNNGMLDERLWVQQDANYNVTALVNTSGAVVERYDFDPYGQQSVFDPNWNSRSSSSYAFNYGFQVTRLDTATGNNYFRAREYRPYLGRWLQNDPARFGGGDSNLYRIERNSTIGHSDPFGLYEEDVHFYMTYYLSLAAGLGDCNSRLWREKDKQGNKKYLSQAYAIAWADQFTDDHPWTEPLQLAYLAEGGFLLGLYGIWLGNKYASQVRQAFHFPIEDGESKVRPNTDASRKTLEMGIKEERTLLTGLGMHTFQDSWSHATQQHAFHHPFC